MRKILIFLGGFVAGILATILVLYIYSIANKTNDGLPGLTIFEGSGKCLTTNSKYKSSEIEIFQVIAPDVALAKLKYYSDDKIYDNETIRHYDIRNDVVVLIVNDNGETYYDDQKIEISNKCAKQIGIYQYNTKNNFAKTVPAVVIE